MIDPRKLDRTITIERRTAGLDADRQPVETWAPIGQPIAAQRLENGSREFRRAYGAAEEGEAVFRVRFVAGITTADRLVFDGDALDIVAVIELGRRAGLDLRTRTPKA